MSALARFRRRPAESPTVPLANGAPPRPRVRLELWVPLIYAAGSALWIVVTDVALAAHDAAPRGHLAWSVAKGLGFVFATAGALHTGLKWSLARERRAQAHGEEVLRESEERLALAVEAAGLGIWHAQPFREVRWSPRVGAILGIAEDSLPTFDAYLARCIHPDDREAVRTAVERWLAPGGDGRLQCEYRIVRPDGTVRWVAVHGKVRTGASGGLRSCVGTMQDVTDWKQVQAQLMQSDRLASVGMLAAGVAHEINNPLAYLTAAVHYLGDALGELPRVLPGVAPEVAQALSDAREGAARVRHVVRDLQTLSRAQEDRRAAVELAPVLETCISMAANELKYRARLVRELGPTPPVLANEARLGQVFLNLLINAAQAIPEGRVDVNEIRVVTRTDAQGRAVVEVRDTGGGIRPEVLEHIFDPFFTTKPVGVGSGLGLWICRNILTAIGGEIAVDSAVGVGSTFRVTLPAAAAADRPAIAAPPVTAARRRGRVLVVDDEPAVGGAIQRLLSTQHDVVVLSDAREARDRIARGERFDAILCDLMMPHMSGMDLHAELVHLAPDQAARFVVLTGGAFTPSAEAFLARTPNASLEKPFEPARLREVVAAIVG